MDALSSLQPAQLGLIIALEVAVIGWGTRYLTGRMLWLAPWRPLSYPFLLPGTVLHELAHAVAAVALGLGISELVLFRPTKRPDGSMTLGWVRPRRSSQARGAIMAVAPLLLVPPTLLALAILAANLPSGMRAASIALWLLVGLGACGAFPSRGDHVSARGAIIVVAACVMAGLVVVTVAGQGALSTLLAGAVLALGVPAVVLAVPLALAVVLTRHGR